MTETACRIPLPQLLPEIAQAQSALGRTFTPFPLAVGKARILASLTSAPEAQTSDPWLKLTLDGAEAAVQIPKPMMARCLGQAVENGLASDIALLLEDALADWLDVAEAAGLPTVRFGTVTKARPALPIERSLALRGQSVTGQFVQFRLPTLLSLSAAQRLSDRLKDRIEPRKLPNALMVRAEIHLNGPKIYPDSLDWLTVGDGIRLPFAYGLEPPASFTLQIGDYQAAIVPERDGYRLSTALRPKIEGHFPMDHATEEADTAVATDTAPADIPVESNAPDVESLPVQLSFRVGEAALSLGELGTLGAGAVIPVPGGPDSTLDILANGQKIGRGELVAVGETRAVRVISLD